MALSSAEVALFISIFNLMLAGVMIYSRIINKNIPGTGWWALGVSGLSIGLVLIIIYSYFSRYMPALIVTGRALQIYGAGAVVYGCGRFAGKSLNFRSGIIILSVLTVLLGIFLLLDFFLFHVVLINSVFIFIYIRGFLMLLSARRGGSIGGLVVSFPFFAQAVFHFSQVVLVIRYGNEYYQHFSPAMLYASYSVLFGGLVFTLVQQGYFKFRENLNASAEEKSLLLREMHHRTKNNLALITSMIALDSQHVKDPAAVEILDVLKNKINIIALLHRMLQDVDAAKHVRLDEYLELIADSFSVTEAGRSGSITLDKKIEPVTLEVASAIPLGLILNELIANCRKHAFTEGADGRISLTVSRHGKMLEVIVSDDGRGLDDHPVEGSLGLSLVKSLTSQLHGEFSLGNNTDGKGSRAALSFPFSA